MLKIRITKDKYTVHSYIIVNSDKPVTRIVTRLNNYLLIEADSITSYYRLIITNEHTSCRSRIGNNFRYTDYFVNVLCDDKN